MLISQSAETSQLPFVNEFEQERILERAAYQAISKLGYGRLKSLKCKASGRSLTLTGKLESFHHLALVLSTMMKVDRGLQIINRVEVNTNCE